MKRKNVSRFGSVAIALLLVISGCKNRNTAESGTTTIPAQGDTAQVITRDQAAEMLRKDSIKQENAKPKPAPAAASIGKNFEYVLRPGIGAGPIRMDFDRKKLDSALGKNNVVTADLDMGEGQRVKGVKIFPGTTAEAEIFWHKRESQRYIALIRISKAGSPWKFRDGLKIGSTMEEVRLMNAGDFNIFGFGWDYGGQVASFNKGNLDRPYQIRKMTAIYFQPTHWKDLSEADRKSISGDQWKSTSLPAMKKAQPVVSKMILYFN